MKTDKNKFNQRLKQLIESRHLTQKEVADKADITEAAMSHYIKGDRIPRASVLARIAIVLDTTSDYLMEGVPFEHDDEILYAKRLIARNVDQMSLAEKKEILSILLGDDGG